MVMKPNRSPRQTGSSMQFDEKSVDFSFSENKASDCASFISSGSVMHHQMSPCCCVCANVCAAQY